MTEIKKLLTVLDMSEEELFYWLCHNEDLHHYGISVFPDSKKEIRISLADLAFRLRDEVENKSPLAWHSALFDVYMHVKGPGHRIYNWRWASSEAKPIHWIIAALIAKAKDK